MAVYILNIFPVYQIWLKFTKKIPEENPEIDWNLPKNSGEENFDKTFHCIYFSSP